VLNEDLMQNIITANQPNVYNIGHRHIFRHTKWFFYDESLITSNNINAFEKKCFIWFIVVKKQYFLVLYFFELQHTVWI